jgi:hypothetical protein
MLKIVDNAYKNQERIKLDAIFDMLVKQSYTKLEQATICSQILKAVPIHNPELHITRLWTVLYKRLTRNSFIPPYVYGYIGAFLSINMNTYMRKFGGFVKDNCITPEYLHGYITYLMRNHDYYDGTSFSDHNDTSNSVKSEKDKCDSHSHSDMHNHMHNKSHDKKYEHVMELLNMFINQIDKTHLSENHHKYVSITHQILAISHFDFIHSQLVDIL